VLGPVSGLLEEGSAHSSCQCGLQVGLVSDVGCVRHTNEDACLVWQYLVVQQGQPVLPMGLFVVADGVGGQSRGERASILAVRLAAQYVIRQVCLPLLGEDGTVEERTPINEILEAGVSVAHEAILRRLPEAGTTMTMALLVGDSVFVAHVGDCRAYVGERGHLHCLTQDHSVAARLLDVGQGTPQQIAAQRNILYKVLGRGTQIEPDVVHHDLNGQQYLLLCSDGLWNQVSDEEMAGIVEAAPTLSGACQSLVDRAKERGGDDNISVVLAARDWPLAVHDRPPIGGDSRPCLQ
jgi:serine/threonine protein phosphatase PrpC